MSDAVTSIRPGRVLVLGDNARTVLPIARSLGRRGGEVHLAWESLSRVLTASRYIHAHHQLPPGMGDPERALAALTELDEQYQFEVVFPATEAVAVLLCNIREQLPSRLRLAIPNTKAADVVFDKQQTELLSERLGIPIPPAQLLTHSDQLSACRTTFAGPIVVKPLSSTTPASRAKQFVHVYPDWDTFVENGTDGLRFPLLLQEHFRGEGQGIGFLAERGKLRTLIQHRRLHETTGHGSTYRQTVAVQSQLAEAVRKLVEELEYDGVGMCEFRLNRETGDWVLLEINGRFWGSLPLATAAGVDFPWLYYLQLRDLAAPAPESYRVGVRSRMLREDLRWMWRSVLGRSETSCGEDGWKLSDISRTRWTCDLLRLISGIDYIDSFCWSDLQPFQEELKLLLRKPLGIS